MIVIPLFRAMCLSQPYGELVGGRRRLRGGVYECLQQRDKTKKGTMHSAPDTGLLTAPARMLTLHNSVGVLLIREGDTGIDYDNGAAVQSGADVCRPAGVSPQSRGPNVQ